MRWLLTSVVLVVPVILFAQARAPHIVRKNPSTLSRPTGYSHVVEVSGAVRTIYVAGQVAADRDGNVVGANDMKAQTEQVFKNLEAALAASGATFADVVKMNTYATDLSQSQAYRDVRARYYGADAPASTLVQVVRLARPEYMLEVEVVAAVRDGVRVVPAKQ